VNGDGTPDIIVAGNDGRVYAVDSSNCDILWSKQVADYINPSAQNPSPQDIESSPTVADLDGDGDPEIILTTGWMPESHKNGALLVLDHNGNLMPGWPRLTRDVNGAGTPAWNPDGYADGFFSTPAVGDIDGDGQLEIVAGAFDKCIYAMEIDGTPVTGWWDDSTDWPARCLVDTIWSSPALADLDGDGAAEIIIGTDAHSDYNGGSVWVLRGDNTLFPGWPVYTTQIVQSSPAVGDIDGDAQLEIVVGTGTYYPTTGGHKVYAFERDGTAMSGWPVATTGNMPNSPALADLDEDGKLEVVMGCGGEADVGNSNACSGNDFYIWHHDGSLVSGYPTAMRQAIPWDPPAYGVVPIPPVLADFDDNGIIDVFAVSAGAIGISVFPYNNPAAVMAYSPVSTDPLRAAPLLVDLDGDGGLEMVAASGYNDKGVIYIWKLSVQTAGSVPWPMYRRTPARDGAYKIPPRLAIQSQSLYLLHDVGDTMPSRAAFTVTKMGDGSVHLDLTSSSSITVSPEVATINNSLQVEVVVDTADYQYVGVYFLGDITVTGTMDGETIEGSPIQLPVVLWVDNFHQVYIPLTASAYRP
jgi:hypothetical protein